MQEMLTQNALRECALSTDLFEPGPIGTPSRAPLILRPPLRPPLRHDNKLSGAFPAALTAIEPLPE